MIDIIVYFSQITRRVFIKLLFSVFILSDIFVRAVFTSNTSFSYILGGDERFLWLSSFFWCFSPKQYLNSLTFLSRWLRKPNKCSLLVLFNRSAALFFDSTFRVRDPISLSPTPVEAWKKGRWLTCLCSLLVKTLFLLSNIVESDCWISLDWVIKVNRLFIWDFDDFEDFDFFRIFEG